MKLIHVLLLCALLLSGGSHAAEFAASDARIRYSGRWDRSEPTRPWCAWQGSALAASFRGTAIRAEIESTAESEYFRVIVDGDQDNSRKFELISGRHSYQLATGLKPGGHEIHIVKETYISKGRMTFLGFEVEGLGLSTSERRPPRLRIEFYGDSNLAGYSLEHEKNKGGAAKSGCYYTFAGIVSRALGAEYHNISSSGAIISGRLNSVLSFYNRTDFHQPEPRWDFSSFQADICVINIGANDIGSKTRAQIKNDYLSLLKVIRTQHPNAHIVVMNGYGWAREEPANYTHEVVEAFGDGNVSRLVFPWLFNEWHGCEYDHAGMARYLLEHLEEINPDWKQVNEMDVMDGFGRDGNVANGSFELVAPFGGYGWRYFQDGAQRVRSPERAHEGDWFLRLPHGTQVHQPNPSSGGSQHSYRMFMRSRTDRAVVRVRVEFRDQEWRHEIPRTAREFEFDVGGTWKEYTVDVLAPASGSTDNLSHAVWQAILRIEAKSGIVDVDAVTASRVAPEQPPR